MVTNGVIKLNLADLIKKQDENDSENINLILSFINKKVDIDNEYQYLLVLTKTFNLVKLNLQYSEFSENIISHKIQYDQQVSYTSESEKHLKFPFQIMAYTLVLNRLYFLLNTGNAFMYDFEVNQLLAIKLESEAIPKLYGCSSCFMDTKLIITGGVTLNNKLSLKIFSFDIALYEIKEEKIKENNFGGRYRHGSIIVSEHVYVIGGLSSIREEKACNDIKAIKYDNLMYKWNDYEPEGPKPEYFVDPEVCLHNESIILAYSSYKYSKVYCLNLKTKASKLIIIDTEIGPSINFFNSVRGSMYAGSLDYVKLTILLKEFPLKIES